VASGLPGDLSTGLAGSAADALFDSASHWVADGAVWLLDQVGSVLSASTSVDLTSSWFTSHVAVMAGFAALVIVPMLCAATIQAIARQDASMLLRSFLVKLPLALLLSGVAIELVQLALSATDALSAAVAAGSGLDLQNLLSSVTVFLSAAGAGVPSFVVFLTGLLVVIGAFVLWLELAIRAAAVSAAALFLPLVLATLVWPAISHWCRRLADTLVALVLSKFVIVAVLSLAVGATDSGQFTGVVSGVALLLLATFCPFTLLRLVPAVEAGAVAHLEGVRHRVQQLGQHSVRSGTLAVSALGGALGVSDATVAGPVGSPPRGDIRSILPQLPGTPDDLTGDEHGEARDV
jgi:hypothetical protein